MNRKGKKGSFVYVLIMVIAIVAFGGACAKKDVPSSGEVTEIPKKPTATSTATPEPTATATPTATHTPTPTPEPTATPTVTPTATPEVTKGPRPTKKPSVTPDPNAPKKVAFTFDDGPYGKLTPKFAEKLAEYGGHGTWFVVGNRINDKTGAQLREIAEQGNEIAIHAYTHEYMFNKCSEAIYREELEKTANAIKKWVAGEITLMRPVGGAITKERVESCPYAVILWSVDSNDWRYKKRDTETQKQENIQKIVDNVMKSVGDGDIILMHEIYDNSYEAFCIIIDKLAAQGYEFVTVSELLNDPTSGYKYSQR